MDNIASMPPQVELEQPIVKQEIYQIETSIHSPSPPHEHLLQPPLMLPIEKPEKLQQRLPPATFEFDHFQAPITMIKEEQLMSDHISVRASSPVASTPPKSMSHKSPSKSPEINEKQPASDPVDSDEIESVLDEVKRMRTKPISSFSDTDDKINKIDQRKNKEKKRERRKHRASRKHHPTTTGGAPVTLAPTASSSDSEEDGFSSSNQVPAAANRRSKSTDKERKRGRPRKNASTSAAPPSKKAHSQPVDAMPDYIAELSSGSSKKHEMSPIKSSSSAALFVPTIKKESSVSSSASPKKGIRSRRTSRVNSNIKSRETLDTTESSSDDDDGKTAEESLLFTHSPKKVSKKHKERIPIAAPPPVPVLLSPKKVAIPSKTMRVQKMTSDESDGHVSDDDEEMHSSR
jgi:hypothetical protein